MRFDSRKAGTAMTGMKLLMGVLAAQRSWICAAAERARKGSARRHSRQAGVVPAVLTSGSQHDPG